jgi:mono/diheme cytochrome c family protein
MKRAMISRLSYASLKWAGAAGLLLVPVLMSTLGWADSDGAWRGGPDVYGEVCAYCHDTGVGPVTKGRHLPPTYIEYVVRHGLLAMPAFSASFIEDKSLQDVARYISESPVPDKK